MGIIWRQTVTEARLSRQALEDGGGRVLVDDDRADYIGVVR